MSERFYWRAKLGKDMPWIGVVSWFGPPLVDGEELDRSPRWQCLVRTETTARAILFGDNCPIEVEGRDTLRNLERITEAEWSYLVKHAAWSTQHRPDLPDAAPRTKIDRRGKSIY